jgi:outer membrane biosynthesis protein TonB
MSAMRPGLLLALLILACAPESFDVMMDPTSISGVFRSDGIGTLFAPMPDYPEYLRMAGIEGMNQVSLRFADDWTAESVRIARPAGNAGLDQGATRGN